jgi:hypothetical protein
MNSFKLSFDILGVFLLGICIALQKFDEAANIEDLLFLRAKLVLLLFKSILKCLHC